MALALACIFGSSCSNEPSVADYNVVPLPSEIKIADGEGFNLNKSTIIAYPAENAQLKRNAELFADYLKQLTGYQLEVSDAAPAENVIILSDTLAADNAEAYAIVVDNKTINVNGASAAGNFYGLQTLRKAIDASKTGDVIFPASEIFDQPRFGYRGAHFDVARHFFPVDSVKAFIDMIALHNMNRLHWHLTDDQGWRLEIEKYPKLTEVGANRAGTCVGHDFDSTDSIPYGGFYTKAEAIEIVQYAADRHITVIPEIDLPGHMVAALTAYPELGCTGGPYEVWQRWGISEDVLCAGNDKTLEFISDVMTEVAAIFPSEYIHIGGDECPKVRWEKCPKCQARIAQLGLKADAHSSVEQKLQNYLMEHASKTLASLGRKMIGWDEITEGGLFPGATVMSWRGMDGAIKAAQQGHDAIMTPTNYCYFDYAQSRDNGREPLGIGGYLPVAKVYEFDPTADLTPEQAGHILGVQCNLWTEYIATFSHVQYMELPRMAALADVQWTALEKKNFDEFTGRLTRFIEHYKALGYNYATHIFDVQGGLTPDYENHVVKANLRAIDNAPIYYTLDGTEPTEASNLYTEPVVMDKTCKIRAVVIRPETGRSYEFTDSVFFSKATSAKVTLNSKPHTRYSSIMGGDMLTDGRVGTTTFHTGEWMGFEGTPIDATLDLGEVKSIQKVTLRILVDCANWIFDTRGVEIEVSSDGKEFKSIVAEKYPAMTGYETGVKIREYPFQPTEARYIRVKADCETCAPQWQEAAKGKPCFLFTDEFIVE